MAYDGDYRFNRIFPAFREFIFPYHVGITRYQRKEKNNICEKRPPHETEYRDSFLYQVSIFFHLDFPVTARANRSCGNTFKRLARYT